MMMNEIPTHSLFDLSWQVTEDEYRANPALSYSTIARFSREGFDGLPKLFDKIESPSLLFGSLVDTLLTGTKEEFEERFLVAEFPKIPESQVLIIRAIFKNYSDRYFTLEEVPTDVVLGAAESASFQPNWKPETKVAVIKKNGGEYYKLLHLATNKILVGTEEFQNAKECVSVLKTHPYSRTLFLGTNPFNPSIQTFYQLKFKGVYKDIQLRCMADLIRVDHENKIIYPYDLKTSFKKEWEFHHSFMQWGYWIQAQLYWYIIRQNLDNDPVYKEYTLADYRFVVISNNNRLPLVWEYSDTQVEVTCYYGKNRQFECKNWREIVPELNYYIKKQPSAPLGIKEVNNIINWLNRE